MTKKTANKKHFLVSLGLAALIFIIVGFRLSGFLGVLALLVSPLFFLLYVAASRVWLEVMVVVFRIAEHTGKIADQCQAGGGAAPAPPTL